MTVPISTIGMLIFLGVPSGGGSAGDVGCRSDLAEFAPEGDATHRIVAAADDSDEAGANPDLMLYYRRKGRRAPVRLGAGLLVFRRAVSVEHTPVSYDAPIPAVFLDAELYPWAIGGNGYWPERFGAHLRGYYSYAVTTTEQRVDETSQVVSVDLGLKFRFALWNKETAPDFGIELGYGMFSFPMDQGVLPGVQYSGPYAAAALTMPVDVAFALVLDATARPYVFGSGDLELLGVEKYAFSGVARVGFRVAIGPVELTLGGWLEYFRSSYRGVTTLRSTATQYRNVSLNESRLGVLITVGWAMPVGHQ